MADASRTVDIIFRGQNQLGAGVASVEQSLGGIGEEASEAEKKVDGLGNEVEALGGKPQEAVNKMNIALKALAAGLIVDRFIDANKAAEQFRKTIEYSTGSTQEAAAEWEYITGVADKYGVSLESVSGAYSRLIAGTQGSTLSSGQLRSVFEGVAGSLSAVGGTSQDVAEALRQLTQGIGKNRFELEDLRSVAERLPGGMYAVAEAVGVTTDELYEQIKAGKFGTEEILKYTDSLNKNLAGVNFDTFSSALERLKGKVDESLISLGDVGGFELLKTAIEGVTATAAGAIGTISLLAEAFSIAKDAWTNKTPLNTPENIERWDAAVNQIANGIRTANERFLELGGSASGAASGIDKASGSSSNAVGTIADLSKYLEDAAKNSDRTGTNLSKSGKQIQSIIPVYDEVTGKVIGYTDGISGAADIMSYMYESSSEAAEGIEKIGKAAENLDLKEKLALIDSQTQVAVANIKAGAEIITSAFESVNVGIESTGELLGSLFDNLGEADSFREMFQIEDQIKLENERRTKELELQEKLTKATIDELKARQQMMKSGGALITVNGDGLQPHLEAFMWEILEAIQVRVNADGYEMLLGGP